MIHEFPLTLGEVDKPKMIQNIHSFGNLFLTAGSFLAYTMLAFFQNVGDLTIYKDVGMGAAFIATCFFMFRYFVGHIDKKDAQLQELSNKYLEIIQQKITSDAETRAVINTLVAEVKELNHAK